MCVLNNKTTANSRFAQSRFSGSFMIFLTKNNYLGGKNSAPFPRLGKAAKRYVTFVSTATNKNHAD